MISPSQLFKLKNVIFPVLIKSGKQTKKDKIWVTGTVAEGIMGTLGWGRPRPLKKEEKVKMRNYRKS